MLGNAILPLPLNTNCVRTLRMLTLGLAFMNMWLRALVNVIRVKRLWLGKTLSEKLWFSAEGSRVYLSISFLGMPLNLGKACCPTIGSSVIVR